MSIYRSQAGADAVARRYLEVLDRWPVPSQHMRFPTREGETFVVACGRDGAPPVLMFQGSGANAAMWMSDVSAWAEHFRVFAVDVIGEPGLSAPSRPPLASPAYALWIDDVMDALGLKKAAMAGVSLGAWLALDYATRRPDRVQCLALLNPSGIGRRRVSFLFKALALYPFGEWGRRRTLTLALGPASPDPSPDDLALGGFAQLIFRHFKPRLEPVPTIGDDALSRLTMPILVTVGGRDALLDAHETKRRLQRVLPRARALLLPEAGHFLRDQAPAMVEFTRDATAVGRDEE